MVAPLLRHSYADFGDCGSGPHWSSIAPNSCLSMIFLEPTFSDHALKERIDHASCFRDCNCGMQPCPLLLFFHGRLQADTANRASPARVGAGGSRCPHLAGAWLQDALLGCGGRPRQRFLGHLHPEQVSAGNRPGAGHSNPRRFLCSRVDDGRSQSGCRGTSAGWPSPEARPKNAEAADEAKTAQVCCVRPGRIVLPEPCAGTQPLIACTAPNRVRIVRRSQRA
jgi:hypothetical protein